jgi:two-component system cell cycle response regulator CtrA
VTLSQLPRSASRPESIIETGRLVIDLDTHVALVEDRPVALTEKEYGIIELLSLRKGTILTKEMFLDHLYGGTDEPELKIIDVFVCKLRKKIAEASLHRDGVGPRLCPSRPGGAVGCRCFNSR